MNKTKGKRGKIEKEPKNRTKLISMILKQHRSVFKRYEECPKSVLAAIDDEWEAVLTKDIEKIRKNRKNNRRKVGLHGYKAKIVGIDAE